MAPWLWRNAPGYSFESFIQAGRPLLYKAKFRNETDHFLLFMAYNTRSLDEKELLTG
jgi:hypothetical protein